MAKDRVLFSRIRPHGKKFIGYSRFRTLRENLFSRELVLLSRKSLMLLSLSDRKRLIVSVIFSAVINVMDLILTLILGIVIAISLGTGGQTPSVSLIANLVHFLETKMNSGVFKVAVLLSLGILLGGKSYIQVRLYRWTLIGLAQSSAATSSDLFRKLLGKKYDWLKQQSRQQILYAFTAGFQSTSILVQGNILLIFSDTLMFGIFSGIFLIADPGLFLVVAMLFSIMSLFSIKATGTKALSSGVAAAEVVITSNRFLLDSLSLFREIHVNQRMDEFSTRFHQIRRRGAETIVESQLTQQIPRLLMDVGVVAFLCLFMIFNQVLGKADNSIGSLVIFSTMLMRLSPVVLRMQSNFLNLRMATGAMKETFEIIDQLHQQDLERPSSSNSIEPNMQRSEKGLSIQIKDLCYRYPDADNWVFENFSCEISSGEFVALVGPSGSGKSTLVDLILGLIEPTSGSILIDGLKPGVLIERFPSLVSFLPQEVTIFQSTIRENITLDPDSVIDGKRLWRALQLAQLDTFVKDLPRGLETKIYDEGINFSGGQRQRMGLARVFFNESKFLILDEPTSALDSANEIEVNEVLKAMRGDTTILCIAHTENTIRGADKIIDIS